MPSTIVVEKWCVDKVVAALCRFPDPAGEKFRAPQTISLVQFVVFDVLERDGELLKRLPWNQRRQVLAKDHHNPIGRGLDNPRVTT